MLRVASTQLRERGMSASVARIADLIGKAARGGAQVVTFPEAALTGYGPEMVASAGDVAAAEDDIRNVCRRHSIASIVGSPRDGSNSALVVNADGAVVCRQHKMQLVPTDLPWTKRAGDALHVFELFGCKCAVIICHDKRYPELVRLPVLAGARVIFYISAESWHDDLPLPAPRDPPWDGARLEREMGVYRAQAQARAVENRVWLVKSNFAGERDDPTQGSHGQSCVVDPTGIVVAEAGVYDETLVHHTLDLSKATALYADKSLLPEYALAGWWRSASGLVRHVGAGAGKGEC